MPGRNFALGIQLAWPLKASMGGTPPSLEETQLCYTGTCLISSEDFWLSTPHFHCLGSPTWTWIHSSGTSHQTCLQLPGILLQGLSPESFLQQPYLHTSHKSRYRNRNYVKKKGNVVLPQITNSMIMVPIKMI